MSKEAIYKARITFGEDKVSIISYANQKIPFQILGELNDAVHDVIDKINGKVDWKQSYIRFTHEGKTYHQVDNTGLVCEGCCFLNDVKGFGCMHPYFTTKGNCNGRIYKEEK